MRSLFGSTRFADLSGIILICLVLILIPGCGRKMFPKPSGEEGAPQVRDLGVQVTSRGVELSWSPIAAAAEGKLRYQILRTELSWENRNCADCPGIGPQALYGIDPPAVASALTSPDHRIYYLDAQTSLHRAYKYQVSIRDSSDNQVAVSHPVVAKLFAGPPPPVNVAASAQHQGIVIQWKPAAKDAQGRNIQGDVTYRVERMAAGKPWERISPQVKGNSYVDQGISADQSYSYRVVPVMVVENTPIQGEPSGTVLAKAPEAIPPPPPNSVWVIPARGALEIRWTESDGKIGGYHVYRREGKEIIRLTASPVQHPPFLDKNVKRNETYGYAVSAVNDQADHKEGLLSKWAEMRALLQE